MQVFGTIASKFNDDGVTALYRALLDAGIPFLFGCYVTDTLRDREGRPAGVVIAIAIRWIDRRLFIAIGISRRCWSGCPCRLIGARRYA